MSINQIEKTISQLQKSITKLENAESTLSSRRWGCQMRENGANFRINELVVEIHSLRMGGGPGQPPPRGARKIFVDFKILFLEYKIRQEQKRVAFYAAKQNRLLGKQQEIQARRLELEETLEQFQRIND